jgi:hypothetical protein
LSTILQLWMTQWRLNTANKRNLKEVSLLFCFIMIIYINVIVNNHQSWFICLQHLQIKCKLNICNMFFYIRYCLEVIYKF